MTHIQCNAMSFSETDSDTIWDENEKKINQAINQEAMFNEFCFYVFRLLN